MNQLKSLCLCATLVFCLSAKAQYKIEVLDTNTFFLGEGVVLSKTSFRGLSVVDNQIIWVSGSRGTVARSTDGGKTFHLMHLKGYEQSDFRDIEAFDDKRAIIMSSGSPAYILKTTDGGKSWKEVYQNKDTAYFLDAMDFWDEKRGVLVGDPINGHFVLLQTNDGGETWQEWDSSRTPEAMEGEAVFAASGTSLRCWGENEFGFVTGGRVSRFFHNTCPDDEIVASYKNHWTWLKTYMMKGESGQGAFSLSYFHEGYKGIIIVGGDYKNDSLKKNIAHLVSLNGHVDYKWKNEPNGYKSCFETLVQNKNDKYRLGIAVGTSGVEMFTMFEWDCISKQPFHVVRKAKKGKAVFLAGPKGKIGKLIY
jgi:hypothetical protein